jgi:hypothetical protein
MPEKVVMYVVARVCKKISASTLKIASRFFKKIIHILRALCLLNNVADYVLDSRVHYIRPRDCSFRHHLVLEDLFAGIEWTEHNTGQVCRGNISPPLSSVKLCRIRSQPLGRKKFQHSPRANLTKQK